MHPKIEKLLGMIKHQEAPSDGYKTILKVVTTLANHPSPTWIVK